MRRLLFVCFLAACGPDTSSSNGDCGNGLREEGEDCDGLQLGGDSCANRGYVGGDLACSSSCHFDETACTNVRCGDGAIGGAEQCDGSALADQTCVTQGFDAGTLACSTSCTFDTSACTNCGDGTAAGVESCDTTDLDGATCATSGFTAGTLACTSGCTLDTSACTTCGDGTREGTESCDMTDLNSSTCMSLGYTTGTLACASNCSFDTAGCSTCGNNDQELAEQCDGTDLANQMCSTRGFTAGTLACTNCSFDTSACTTCGNNDQETGEECDGPDLASQTCALRGFTTGTLSCSNSCTFDTSACTTCGNGTIETGEQCEGANLNSQTCITQGFASGVLSCSACGFNTSLCSTFPAPSSGGLVITEVMPDPAGTDTVTGEWFEIYNPSPTVTYQLRGCTITNAPSPTESFTITGDLTIAPQSYRTFASVASPGFTPSYVYTGFVLANTTDTIRITCENGLVDAVTYDGTFSFASGASASLRVGLDATDNDTGTNWCESATPLGSQFGTPNVQNTCPQIFAVADCRVQFPSSLTQNGGSTATVYGRVSIPGVTDLTTNNDPNASLRAAVGVGPDGTNPNGNVNWTWATASANAAYMAGSPGHEPAFDEYMATLSIPSTAGPYDYAYRFSIDAGATWTYCDVDGGAYAAANAGQLTSTAANVWINEFHYENTGADADEGFEIAGLAGTVLNGYSIVVYNGSTSQTNGTTPLSGTLTNQTNGYGFVWVGVPGLQNDLEGFALVSANGVVEFLCYEGTITATNGPASGMTCTNTNVTESDSVAVGVSLQRGGTGSTGASFIWQAPLAHTHDAVNTNQVCQ